MLSIVWFRRDLRLTDNPALAEGARLGRVLPVYIHAPNEEAPWQPGSASLWWLHHSLAALQDSLRRVGAPLLIMRGGSRKILLELAQRSGAQAVFWNRLYEPAILRRDQVVKEALASNGIETRSFNASLLLEPWQIENRQGRPYRVFTPFWKTCRSKLEEGASPIIEPPARLKPARGLGQGELEGCELEALGLLPKFGWDGAFAENWTPGESAALDRLENFFDAPVADYETQRDRPDVDGTSRLSAHFHFGECGPRQAYAAAQLAQSELGAVAEQSLSRFLAEIGWREFAHHLLFHFPESADSPLNPGYSRFPWWRSDDPSSATLPHHVGAADHLAAWQQGRTGIALVDAAMRQLWSSGWMHNRSRMIVASLLTKNLGIHWLEGARWFWDTLVDADLACNTLGWQWVAGCGADAAPYFRIFNPDSQAERFDPGRVYRDRWLEPGWEQRPVILDLKTSRQAALLAYDVLRDSSQ